VIDPLTAQAMDQPEKLAVVDDRGPGCRSMLTYADLEDRANRLAHVLVDHGVSVGSKVVWCGANSVGVVEFVNAARKIGATAVPLSHRSSDDEAAYVTDHCDASVVYTDAAQAPMFERIVGRLANLDHVLVFDGEAPTSMVSVDELITSAPTTPPASPPDDVATGATMIYTSGTTGRPKGAFRRRSASPEQVGALLASIGFRSDDVHLTTGPISHSGPGGFMAIALAMGQTVVVQRKFDPVDWLRLVATYRCTSTFAAPTPIRMVCALDRAVLDRFDRSSIRIMIANAAPWSLALKQRYLAEFPPDSLFEVYGSTELGVTTILRPEDQLRKPGSCGRAAPMVEIRLYAEDGTIVDGTGPDAVGELFVRSPSVFADYYKEHDRYLEDHREGFQSVGDIAYRDDEGYFYICDRKNDMIISGGMNIYPAEIEGVLERHPDVYEAAVFGVPDDEWGESVHAVVVRCPGCDLDEQSVIDHARGHLARYKVPRSVSWSDELPKTGSGKILKRELRQPFWAGVSGDV
jgi:fatty-acyl-CoA synthase/long-chain acyl-CoA synthetase